MAKSSTSVRGDRGCVRKERQRQQNDVRDRGSGARETESGQETQRQAGNGVRVFRVRESLERDVYIDK
jgi:hypothetical protein